MPTYPGAPLGVVTLKAPTPHRRTVWSTVMALGLRYGQLWPR